MLVAQYLEPSAIFHLQLMVSLAYPKANSYSLLSNAILSIFDNILFFLSVVKGDVKQVKGDLAGVMKEVKEVKEVAGDVNEVKADLEGVKREVEEVKDVIKEYDKPSKGMEVLL